MPKTYLAILVPLTEQEKQLASSQSENRKQARRSVWGTVTQFLKPYLGNEISSFMPALTPWDYLLPMPYGVVLGGPEAILLRNLYCLARNAQSNTFNRYYAQIKDEGKPLAEFSPFEGLTVTVKAVNMADLSKTPAIQWCTRFMDGKLSSEACLYYYGIGNTHVEEDVEKHILSHLEEYALCTVELNG